MSAPLKPGERLVMCPACKATDRFSVPVAPTTIRKTDGDHIFASTALLCACGHRQTEPIHRLVVAEPAAGDIKGGPAESSRRSPVP